MFINSSAFVKSKVFVYSFIEEISLKYVNVSVSPVSSFESELSISSL